MPPVILMPIEVTVPVVSVMSGMVMSMPVKVVVPAAVFCTKAPPVMVRGL